MFIADFRSLLLPVMRFIVATLLALAASPSSAVTVAQPGSPARIALVISNDVYANPKDGLPGALRDANLIQRTLADKRLGFRVTFLRNRTKQQLEQAILDFRAALKRAGPTAVGFFYYAGHGGADANGTDNYLIPTDVENVFAADPAAHGVSVKDMTAKLALLDKRPAIVIAIDACRTPVGGPPANHRGGAITGGAALRMVEPEEQEPGLLVALSASKMSSVRDDSRYAQILASKLLTEGLTIGQVFEQVRFEVSESTHMTQVPVERSKIVDPVCLISCAVSEAGPYSKNSVLLDSARQAAESALKRLASLQAQSRCANGWHGVVALRDSADQALREGRPDVAGATFEKLKGVTDEILRYLIMVNQLEQNKKAAAASIERERARQAARAKDAYEENQLVLERQMKYLARRAARLKQPLDTGEIDKLKATAERLVADGKVEDANDRLVDAINLANRMDPDTWSGSKRHYAIRMFDPTASADNRMDLAISQRPPVCD